MNVSRIGLTMGAFALLASAGACRRIEEPAAGPARGERLTLVYSGNLDGEIEPCG